MVISGPGSFPTDARRIVPCSTRPTHTLEERLIADGYSMRIPDVSLVIGKIGLHTRTTGTSVLFGVYGMPGSE